MRVLYATDGSAAATAAGALIAVVARRDAATCSVLSVIADAPEPGEDEIEGARVVEAVSAERLRDEGFDARAYTEAGADPRRGDPAQVILDEAVTADVVVVGAGSKSWLDRLLLGSVSSAVLHAADASVCVVHAPPTERDRARILAGVDGSPGAGRALELLTELVDPDRCEIEVLAIAQLPLPAYGSGIGTGYAAATFTPEVEATIRELAEDHAREAASQLRDAGFEVSASAVVGSPALSLLERAQAWDADLVVVGSRGMGVVERLFIGSVGSHVARNAKASLIAR